jgi:hypothetical protein
LPGFPSTAIFSRSASSCFAASHPATGLKFKNPPVSIDLARTDHALVRGGKRRQKEFQT